MFMGCVSLFFCSFLLFPADMFFLCMCERHYLSQITQIHADKRQFGKWIC